MVIFQRAGDLPFVLYGGDGQCFGSQFFRYMMDVLFILLRVVGTGAIDQQTAGFQRVPDVVDDAAPASGTERDVRDAPFACTVGIFAKHTFAGTGHVGDDHVKEMRKAADLFRIVVRHDAIRISPLGDIFRQDMTPATDHLIADQQAPFRQTSRQVSRFASRSGAEVEASDRRFHVAADHLFEKHGRRFLHVVGAGMEERVEGKRKPFRQVITCIAPRHPVIRSIGCRDRSAFLLVDTDTDGDIGLQRRFETVELISQQCTGTCDKIYRKCHLFSLVFGKNTTFA